MIEEEAPSLLHYSHLSVDPELVEEVELLVGKVCRWGEDQSQWQVHKLEEQYYYILILDLSLHLPGHTHPGSESLCSRLPQCSGEGVVLRAVVCLMGCPEQVHLWREI